MHKTNLIVQCENAETDTREITDGFNEKYGPMEVNITTGEMRDIQTNE